MLGPFSDKITSSRVIAIVRKADQNLWDLNKNAKIPQKLVARHSLRSILMISRTGSRVRPLKVAPSSALIKFG